MAHPLNPNSVNSRIVAACDVPRGLSVGEIITASGGLADSIRAQVYHLVKQRRLHSAGTRGVQRYFAKLEQAQAYELVFQQERAAAIAAAKRQARAKNNAKRGAQRLAARLAKQTARAQRPIDFAASISEAATITWPAHVQVQRTPVCRDTRFTFTPPPGWQGEFIREWVKRRRGGA